MLQGNSGPCLHLRQRHGRTADIVRSSTLEQTMHETVDEFYSYNCFALYRPPDQYEDSLLLQALEEELMECDSRILLNRP